jgi:HlyD family secretion protein
MSRRLLCWFSIFIALLCFASWALAAQPAAKCAKPAEKTEQTAAKSDKPAAKAEKPVEKSEKKPAKDAKDAKSDKDAKPAAKPAAEMPPTHTIKKEIIKVTIQLDGLFEAKTAHEIFVKPEEWNMLVVESAVPHGSRVRKGDVLIQLETEKIDKTIADLRAEMKINEVSMRQSEDQLSALEKTVPLDLESSRRAASQAGEDRKSFLDVERPFAVKATEFNLRMSKDMLEYEEEELRQLEKMYKADDITEETEQIVLKRARDTVARAKFMVDGTQLYHDKALKFAIPRMEEQVKDLAERKSLDWEKNKIDLPLALQKQRLELEKQRVQRERLEDRLKKILADREMLTIKSPIDGIVYYGKCVRGRFSDSTMMADSLRQNGTIMPNQVVMTVVEPRPMFIRASVPEDQLHRLRPGLKGLATPSGYPDLKLAASVDEVEDIPTGPGCFDARLNVELNRKCKGLMPGMGCKVRFVPYLKKNVIAVPPKAVNTDELDDQKFYVYVPVKDGNPKKQYVTVGEKTDKLVEILKGLAEGDKVLLEAPKEQK